MKAAITTQWNRIAIEDLPRPVPGPGECLVRPTYTGICGFDVERLICETCDLEALEASLAKMIRGEARGKILVRVTANGGSAADGNR